VSNRNLRYRLIKDQKGSSSCSATATEKQANIASAAMLGINEAALATLEQEKSEVDLHQFITSEEGDLRVIALWGTSGDHGKTSAIQEVYGDPEVLKRFGFCAWVRLMYPFNPEEFLRSLVRQFYENSHDHVRKQESKKTTAGADIFEKMEKMDRSDLVRVFNAQLCSNSYLIVINDLSTIEEWQCIRNYFPNNEQKSRIIVSTQNVEIASLCTEKPYQVSVLRQLSYDHTIYLFHKKVNLSSGISFVIHLLPFCYIDDIFFFSFNICLQSTTEHSMTNASLAVFATSQARPTDMEEKSKVGLVELIEIHFLNFMYVNYMRVYKCSQCIPFYPHTDTHCVCLNFTY
jgi:hypothetical protein